MRDRVAIVQATRVGEGPSGAHSIVLSSRGVGVSEQKLMLL
jgi:hypothetical protein